MAAFASGTRVAPGTPMAPVHQLMMPIRLSRDHVRGLRRAPVTLLEYGDYECPHCGIAHAFVEDVRHRFIDDLRFAFRHFPLRAIHPRAERVAEAAEAAGAQGQFWPMHELLFENQHALADDDLLVYASEIGLDVGRFARGLASALYAARVREDFLSGFDSGVTATPTLFINNVRHVGAYDADSLIEAIERVRPLAAGRGRDRRVRAQ
jgi:protein-disulfide isomerase